MTTFLSALRSERDRYKVHSILLNTVCWQLHQAMGVIPEGATDYCGDIEADLPKIIEVIAAAVAWDRARIQKSSTSTYRAADRLSTAVHNLRAARPR